MDDMMKKIAVKLLENLEDSVFPMQIDWNLKDLYYVGLDQAIGSALDDLGLKVVEVVSEPQIESEKLIRRISELEEEVEMASERWKEERLRTLDFRRKVRRALDILDEVAMIGED